MVSDGAAAWSWPARTSRGRLRRAVAVLGRGQANDPMAIDARRDALDFDGARRAFRAALAEAGLDLTDLDLLETHDCFTLAELLQYEAFGLAEPGKGSTVLAEGVTERDGALPVNVSGGPEGEGTPHRRDGRVAARDGGDAARRRGRRHAAATGRPGRGVQHGRRGCRQLRIRVGGGPMSATKRAVNLATLLTHTARRLPDHDAIVHGERRWTWRQLDTGVSALARELTARGVRAGDCVLLHSANHVELVQAMFATWRIGAILAPTNCRLTPSDVTVIAKVCRPVLMFCHDSQRDHAAAVAEAIDTLRGGTLWISGSGTHAIGEIAPLDGACDRVPDADVEIGNPAWYFFTSGTSGSPKAAVLTHDQMGFVVTNQLADLMPGNDRAGRLARARATLAWRRGPPPATDRARCALRAAHVTRPRPGRGLGAGRA